MPEGTNHKFVTGQRVWVDHALIPGYQMGGNIVKLEHTALDGRRKVTVQIDGFLTPSKELVENVRPV